jgi:hypothetical protein
LTSVISIAPPYQEPRDPGRKKLKIQGVLAERLLSSDEKAFKAPAHVR